MILAPARCKNPGASSLPSPLVYSVGSAVAPSKDEPKHWWSEGAWNDYLGTTQRDDLAKRPFFKRDTDFADTEHTYGIELSPDTGSVVEGQFYSASYLRLREGWRLGVFASAPDNDFRDEKHGNDLVAALLDGHGGQILVGGQQRVCTAVRDETLSQRLPLPLGKTTGFTRSPDGKYLVKWILLTPAIWPEVAEDASREIFRHTGGWLPNWIAEKEVIFEDGRVEAGGVLLLDGPGKEKSKRKKIRRGNRIRAKLIAAIVPKPLPVTGWALPNEADPDRAEGGAKSTHLAVPAGAVYYFEAESPEDAEDLASALNWHGGATVPAANEAGATPASTIRNRRSTLMGEKGFGLGVCGTWNFLGEGDGR